jgi:signal transduction histidine kinase
VKQQLGLRPWFRARMVPVVVATGLVVAVSAPLAHYARARHDAVDQAREQAARAGESLRGERDARPTLWRYGSAKLSERLAEAGFSQVPLVVLDEAGRRVKVDAAPVPPGRWIHWGQHALRDASGHWGTVYVASDGWPLVVTALQLLGVFSALSLLLGAVLLGVPLRARGDAEGKIQGLLGRLALTMQEEDRRRMARELHDGVGQALTAARLELQALQVRAQLDQAQVAPITRQLDESMDEVRRATERLAPAALAELGLRRAVERHCAAVSDAAGLEIKVSWNDFARSLSAETETACYRVVQEALANVVRHAQARTVEVRCEARPEGGLRLCVEDDGRGLPAGGAPGSERRGLAGIRERARLLGGMAHVGASAHGGVRVEVELP